MDETLLAVVDVLKGILAVLVVGAVAYLALAQVLERLAGWRRR